MEEASEEKHEYWDGLIVPLSELIAMAGGTYNHSRVTANLIRALGNRLGAGPCAVMTSDMRIKVPRSPYYLYPDTSVVCDKPQFDPESPATTTLLNPRLIAEVLSPSTESYDRGKKLEKYIRIPSLEEYILISQDEPRLDTYFRHADGSWTFNVASGLDAAVAFRSLSITVPLDEIFAGVEFPPEPGAVST